MIDWSRVTELRDEIGAEDFLEVVDLFLSEVGEQVTALEFSPVCDLPDALHAIRGSALNLGFSALAALCVESPPFPAARDVAQAFKTSRIAFLDGLRHQTDGIIDEANRV